VVQRALDEGPQVVTRRGKRVVVIVCVEEYDRLTKKKPSFFEFLISGPDLSVLDIRRSDEMPCEIEF
jgi:prevent-host-death family protein